MTTIVGLRGVFGQEATFCRKQTLGRGLRKMYPGGLEEYVSVVGTDAFMDFRRVDSGRGRGAGAQANECKQHGQLRRW